MTCHLNLLLAVPLFSYLTMNNQKWVVGNEIDSLPFSRGTRGENRSCKHFWGKSLHATQSCLSELFSFQHQPRGTFVYMAQCSLREAWGQVESPWGHGLSDFIRTAVHIHGAEAAQFLLGGRGTTSAVLVCGPEMWPQVLTPALSTAGPRASSMEDVYLPSAFLLSSPHDPG